ncbi:MAG: hydroxyacid aldolase [Salinarimonadaceae bacterium]|nr:MAG: hydroxyacid aldolase [Salinarimonadaceae bacterium]
MSAASPVAALRDAVAAGRPTLSAWCSLSGFASAGLLAGEEFDAVTLDMQHGAGSLADCFAAIPLVAAAGKPFVARIPVGDFASASRLLDAGAAGIIAPMINTLEDARRFAGFMKFPPLGERSWGPHGALALSGLTGEAYFRAANDFCLAFAMVETRESLAILDDILAVAGIDGVFIGPYDLSIGLSGGAVLDPQSPAVEDALDHALARSRAAGKAAGVYAATPERAGEMVRRGFDFVALGSDSSLLRTGAQAALRTARGR